MEWVETLQYSLFDIYPPSVRRIRGFSKKMPTHRQRIAELIADGSWTLHELSAEVHISVKEVLQHLVHVQKSVHPPLRFILEPAGCLNCGFIFKDRRRLSAPSKCPKCRDSHIQDPRYHIGVL